MNASPLNSLYQRPSGEREFNTHISLVLTKVLSKSFLWHILMIFSLQKQSLKWYYHKNFTLLIRLPRAIYPNHDDILYPYRNNADQQYTLQEPLICIYLYSFSYNTLARRPIFFQLSSQKLSIFIYCFYWDILEFVTSDIFQFWKRRQQKISKFC